MLTYVAVRLAQGLLLLLVMSVLVFVAVYAIGNPVTMLINPSSPPEVVEETTRRLGLDQPMHVQYWRFLTHALQGDLGVSYISSQPAIRLIVERFPATLELTLTAMMIALVIGLPCGLVAGYWPSSIVARAIGTLSVVGISLPTFWIGLMLITVLSIQLGLFPTGGRGPTATVLGLESSLFTLRGWRHVALPALNLSLFPMALVIRLTRAGVQENVSANHIRYARQRAFAVADHVPLRAQEYLDPDHHGARHSLRRAARLWRRYRDGVRLAGHRQADHRRDQDQRSAGHHRLPAVHGGAVHADQSRGRSHLRAYRSTRLNVRSELWWREA